jgi:hypothetical protein
VGPHRRGGLRHRDSSGEAPDHLRALRAGRLAPHAGAFGYRPGTHHQPESRPPHERRPDREQPGRWRLLLQSLASPRNRRAGCAGGRVGETAALEPGADRGGRRSHPSRRRDRPGVYGSAMLRSRRAWRGEDGAAQARGPHGHLPGEPR